MDMQALIGWPVRLLLATAVALVLLLSPASRIAAADPHTAQEQMGQELNKEAKQDILSPRFDLGIWTCIIFVLLLLVLSKYAWGPMLEGLRKRELAIAEALAESRKAREEAAKLRDQLQAQMKEAAEQARATVEEARRDAQRMADEMIAKARTEIQGERDRLHRELTQAKDQALQEMWQQSAQLATMISAKALSRQVNGDDHRALLEDALVEMKQAVSDRRAFTGSKA